MDNYQLYSTNISLSGQLKWDLILDTISDDLYISKFNISPVSDNIAFDYKYNNDLLNYKHQDNIKSYYKKIEGDFYSKKLNEGFNSNYPIVTDNYPITQYSDIYFMGPKRPKPFSKYNKDIEFLCPVWIELLDEDLTFVININSIKEGEKNNIVSKSITLKENGNKLHDKFINYFNNYIKYIGLDKGDNKLINIDFNKNSCNVSGISVDSGNKVVTNNDNIISNLLDRERPMMEIDNIITELYKNNNLISKQLFNFNICFNISDILSSQLSDLLKGNKINIEINVKIGDKYLQLKDFYTNYQNISRKGINLLDNDYTKNLRNKHKYKSQINVFNYLKDNICLDLIDKNKFSPTICHWSLLSNNDYIFNVYSGFGSYFENYKNNVLYDINNINSRYMGAPDLKQNKYSKSINNIGWCNNSLNISLKDYKLILQDQIEFLNKSSVFTYDTWVNNVYYGVPKNQDSLINKSINIYTCTCDLSVYTIIFNNIDVKKINQNTLCYIPYDNCLLIISTNPDNITFKGIKNVLESLRIVNDGVHNKYYILNNLLDDKYYEYLKLLKDIMWCAHYPKVIKFNKSLTPYKADNPSTLCNEIKYLKKDKNVNSYIYRYDGYIRPTFIDNKNEIFYNYLYEKKIFNENKTNKDLLRLNYDFIYPSIDFCFYKSKIMNYEKINNKYLIENKWYNNNTVLYIDSCIEFNISMSRNDDINYIIYEYLKNKYDHLTDVEIKYILSLYDVSMTYEDKYEDYSGLEDLKNKIKEINCNIKLILK